jgi:hypothetical protein
MNRNQKPAFRTATVPPEAGTDWLAMPGSRRRALRHVSRRRVLALAGPGGAAALAACGSTESGADAQGAKSASPYTLVWGLRTTATP